MKRPADQRAAREALFAAVEEGSLALGEACRRMRKSVGLTQSEYAKLIGISPRIVIDLERGAGNPTLASLQKIGAPFGLEVGFRRRRQKN